MKVVIVDLDNVVVNFQSGIDQLDEVTIEMYKGRLDEVEGIFGLMKPIDSAIEAVNSLIDNPNCEVYICSTAPWENPSAWSDKLIWVKKYLPRMYKRLMLTHHKELVIGDILIDDRTNNGAGQFQGELIQYGNDVYPNWETTLERVNQIINDKLETV